jgi:hypothetical protein
MTERTARGLTWALLCAVFLAGLAWLAVLPPFEGADETAHWSYLQELTDTGRAPQPGRDTLSADLDRYTGPRPYADTAPFDRTGFPTYRSAHLAHAGLSDARPGRYGEGATPNWEGQHPPLYDLALTPLFRVARVLPYRDALFVLRLASWMLAFAGLAAGALGTLCLAPAWARRHAPLMAAWPFLEPQAIATLARLGNDSACLLEAGVAWLLLLRLSERPARPLPVLGLGAVLGLGLLTKAFFLPIGVGAAAYLAFVGWRTGARGRGLLAAVVVVVVAAAIGGWWYVAQYGLTHDLTGGTDFVALQSQGGLAAGLARNASPLALARGLAALAATFSWTGSWSLARPPEVTILGPLLLAAIPLVTWLARLRRLPTLAWAPVFLAGPLVVSLLYHVLAFVALTGRGASTPGYYLHILAAPLAFAVALGWRRGWLLPALWAYTALFTVGVWALELSMFSGCAAKLGNDPHFSFTGAACLFDLRQLHALGHPGLAALAMAAGAAILAVAAMAAWRVRNPRESVAAEPELTPL